SRRICSPRVVQGRFAAVHVSIAACSGPRLDYPEFVNGSGRTYFLGAVVLYGLSAIYSVFLWRKGFRQADRVNYGLLLLAALFHTSAMLKRGFSFDRCPVNSLYEATTFLLWTIAETWRSEEHTSELQSRGHLVCRLLLE